MNRVLLGILAGAVLLPVLLLKAGYGFVNSFPYGSYQPLAVIVGHYLSIPMLLGSVCGLFLGMIHPRLVLWRGKADRYSVARVYIVVFLCGIFLQYEIRVLRGFVSKGESSVVAELYERLDAGLRKEELLAVQRRVAGGLRYTNGNDSDFILTPGFPFKGISTSVIKFAPPGYGLRDGVVVQLSARWDDPDARSERMVLIQDDLVVAVKPALVESDPRIYWAHGISFFIV